MKKITSPALGDPLPPSGSYCGAPNHSQLAARQSTESERSQSILTFQSCSKSKATIISNCNPEGWTEAEERPSLLAVLAQVFYPPLIFVDFKFSDDWGRLDGKSCWRQGLASHVSGLYHRYFFHVFTHLSIYVASKNVHVYPFARLLDPGACHKLEFLRPSLTRPRPKMHNCLKLSLHQIWLTVYNCTYLLSCEIETNIVSRFSE